jgi:hypothetical protein
MKLAQVFVTVHRAVDSAQAAGISSDEVTRLGGIHSATLNDGSVLVVRCTYEMRWRDSLKAWMYEKRARLAARLSVYAHASQNRSERARVSKIL